MLKKSLGLVSGAALICLFAYGCSSSETTVTPPVADGGGGNTDAKIKPAPDTGVVDPNEEAGTGLCAPNAADVKDFTPTWHAPVGKGQKKCTDTQVDALLTCQLDNAADATACKAIVNDKANKDCAACLLTPSPTAPKYGALVSGDGVIGINYAGCIALYEPNLTDSGCGAKYQALGECSDAACACPVTDDASFVARNKCTTKAETTVCKQFKADADCTDALVAAGAAAEKCDISGGTFIDNAKKYGLIFCAGGAAGDGGTDAAKDAPSDG